ncbi:conserved hypothetical protein [Burkholderiales bacterium 8X]|nr:conserved hypothetical protein [Burkholderiales bacterium 8X]
MKLERDAFGRLVLLDDQGQRHEGVTPVRAFPLSAPEQGISIVGPEGRELVWIDSLADLDADARELLEESLRARDFAPELRQLHRVSSFGVPSTWHVRTDRGDTRFVLKAEEDIRRLDNGALLITSAHGLAFRVADPRLLDRHSRKLLERFL